MVIASVILVVLLCVAGEWLWMVVRPDSVGHRHSPGWVFGWES